MPNIQQARVDKLLTNVSTKYRNNDFIHDRIFPAVSVRKKSDLYRIYERNFRLPETSRADGGLSRFDSFNVSSASYSLEKHALRDVITPDLQENYEPHNLRVDMAEELTDKIMRRKEKACLDLLTSTSWSLGVSLAAAGQWSLNTTTSNPILAMDSASTSIIQESGLAPNYSVMNFDVMLAAKNHNSIAERVKYTSREINENILAGLFNIPELLVSKAAIDSSAEGATSSIAYMMGDNVFVGHKPRSAGPRQVSAGYMFQKDGGSIARRWIDEEREYSEVIEIQCEFQFKVVASLGGYLIRDALA